MHKALVFQNAMGEGPGILADIFRSRGWGCDTIMLFHGEPIPENWRTYSLLVLMGGFMNVYEEAEFPFLRQETEIIRDAMHSGPPVVGFCLGAQLMAKALGARVYKGHKKEIGWYGVETAPAAANDPFFALFPKDLTVFQWHGDTFELPEGANRLFRSQDYPNQAMRVREMNYGFQFHFEITKDMILEWLRISGHELEDAGEIRTNRRIVQDSDLFLPAAHDLARNFFEKYLQAIEAVHVR